MFLAATPAYREFFAYAKIKAREVTVEGENGQKESFWPDCGEDEEVWVVTHWIRFEDGTQEAGSTRCLREPATEKDAKRAMQDMINFNNLTKEELQDLSKCFAATEDDLDYIENRYPNYQSPPADPNDYEAHDVYQARLKALAGLHPKTVELIRKADETKESVKRQQLERIAVQAYFAELAHHWDEDEVRAWQRNNPLGTEWMLEFTHVFEEARREIDPIKYELAFNWLRRKYNLLTAEELSDSILKSTLQRIMPGTLKKIRERLGMTTKRKPGPKPNSEQ
jgi:hypothetical protein